MDFYSHTHTENKTTWFLWHAIINNRAKKNLKVLTRLAHNQLCTNVFEWKMVSHEKIGSKREKKKYKRDTEREKRESERDRKRVQPCECERETNTHRDNHQKTTSFVSATKLNTIVSNKSSNKQTEWCACESNV